MTRHRVLCEGIATLFVFVVTAESFAISSTFDADLEAWTVNSTGSVSYSATGGNPGGFARFSDAGPAPSFRAIAPAKFLGNLLAFDGGIVSFDAIVVSAPDSYDVAGFGLLEITNGIDTFTSDIAPGSPTHRHGQRIPENFLRQHSELDRPSGKRCSAT